MVTGRSTGTGKYTYHERHSGRKSVMVAKMPEDDYTFRIVFKDHGEIGTPVIKVGNSEAQLLWAALSAVAKDFDWKDYSPESETK